MWYRFVDKCSIITGILIEFHYGKFSKDIIQSILQNFVNNEERAYYGDSNEMTLELYVNPAIHQSMMNDYINKVTCAMAVSNRLRLNKKWHAIKTINSVWVKFHSETLFSYEAYFSRLLIIYFNKITSNWISFDQSTSPPTRIFIYLFLSQSLFLTFSLSFSVSFSIVKFQFVEWHF